MTFLSNYREDWTKLVIASFLLCLVFSIGALAQTDADQTLDDEAVSALIGQLKDGLSDMVEESELAAITEKWGAHEDLAGKSKAAILKLLFADFKSVRKDKETQDNVWSLWVKDDGPNTEAEPTPKPSITPNPSITPDPGVGEMTAVFRIEDEKSNLAIYAERRERWCVEYCKKETNCQGHIMNSYVGDCVYERFGHGTIYNLVEFPGDWIFEPAGDGYYYIVSPRAGRALVAGDNADNNIYLQEPKGRDNAKWKLFNVGLGPKKFYIIDKKHGLAIVAGDNPDGKLHHQAPNGRKNAIWNITLLRGTKDIPKQLKVN